MKRKKETLLHNVKKLYCLLKLVFEIKKVLSELYILTGLIYFFVQNNYTAKLSPQPHSLDALGLLK